MWSLGSLATTSLQSTHPMFRDVMQFGKFASVGCDSRPLLLDYNTVRLWCSAWSTWSSESFAPGLGVATIFLREVLLISFYAVTWDYSRPIMMDRFGFFPTRRAGFAFLVTSSPVPFEAFSVGSMQRSPAGVAYLCL